MLARPIVTVSADRNGQPWQGPLNPNPDLTNDAAGWSLNAYSPNGVNVPYWDSGGVTFPAQAVGGNAAARNAVGFARPAAAATYRVRATFRVDVAPVVITLQVASGNSTTTLDYTTTLGSATYNAAGTYTLDLTGALPATADAMPYRFARFVRAAPSGQVPQSIWLDRMDMSYYVPAYAPVDVTCLVDQVSIRHGRDDTTSQPSASTATLDVSWLNHEDTLPSAVEIGAGVFVDLEWPPGSGTLFRRFAGRVTDIDLGWEDAAEETPDHVAGQIIAAGYVADLGSRVVGDQPWPQELDGARVARILSLAAVTTDPVTSDPGTVQILARDVDSQPALGVAQGVAESAGGLVWETRAGDVRYADAQHRRGAGVATSLDACDLLVSPAWRRNTDGLINKVSIGYGVAPDGGEQPRYLAQRDDSITQFGTYAVSPTTELAALADAQAMGQLLLTRNHDPVWLMSQLPVDMVGLDADRTAILLAADVHTLLQLTGLPAAGAAPTTALLWVEGWQETLAAGVHELTLAVSGYCRTSPPPTWDDVNPTWTWDTVDPSLTWDDATCFGPPTTRGRWADVPASLRWDGVDPAITWDTWNL